MVITRKINGVEHQITLTHSELRKAYDEQQHLYDIDDIDNELEIAYEDYAEEYGLEKRPVTQQEKVGMALRLRKLLDYDADASWSACRSQAVSDILSEREEARR